MQSFVRANSKINKTRVLLNMRQLFGIIFIVMGLSWILFYRRLGRKTVEFQKRHFRSQKSIRFEQIMTLIMGTVSVAVGILILLNIIDS